jgi:molecular chaperone GrpE
MSKHQKPGKEGARTTETTAESAKTTENGAENTQNSPDLSENQQNCRDTSSDSPDTAGTPADSAGAGEAPAEKAAELTAEEQIEALETKLAEANDLYLRKAADFENFRKRMNQEKQNAIDFANQNLLLDLITVIDDFERAIKSAETQREAGKADELAANYNSLLEGIGMIEKNLVSQLENKWGLKRFDSAGEPFDPNRHEAIMMEKSAEIEDPVVAEDFIKGYLLKDRVIRPAKVKVVMPENK